MEIKDIVSKIKSKRKQNKDRINLINMLNDLAEERRHEHRSDIISIDYDQLINPTHLPGSYNYDYFDKILRDLKF